MKKTLVFLAVLLVFLLFNVQEGMTMPEMSAEKKKEKEKEKEEKHTLPLEDDE